MKHMLENAEKVNLKRKYFSPYFLFILMYIIFLIAAFLMDTPAEIAAGLVRILTSRSVLISDYTAIGGCGATLINAVIVGIFTISFLCISKVKPNGATIMGLFLTTGFAFFGKNIFNMIPISFGVWIFSRVKRRPFRELSLSAMLSATLSPIVSEIAFSDAISQPLNIILGSCAGVCLGFIFPVVSSSLVRIHNGFCLYNMGFSGGVISTIVVAFMENFGLKIEKVMYWNTGNTGALAILLYIISILLVAYGLIDGEKPSAKFDKLKKIQGHTGRLVTDYYLMYDTAAYINMGILCALGTTVILVLGGDINGPTIGAVFTMAGFGAFGKHLRNTVPILVGATVCTYMNMWDPVAPVNILAILFSTCAAPIAGKFGWKWGIIVGFLHVALANFIGTVNGGLNLYNNGFASGFVIMILLPIIMAFQKEKENGI